MEDLVTIDQLKDHLKIPLSQTAQDDDLELKLGVAQEMVIDYISQRIGSPGVGDAWADTIEDWTDETAPKRVVAAILAMAAWIYKHRGDEATQDAPVLEHGDLPCDVKLYLTRLRDPALR